MLVIVTFHFSFYNNRPKTIPGGNLKNIPSEGSINQKNEEYSLREKYDIANEISFRKNIERALGKYVRRSPSINKCIFKCDTVPNRHAILGNEFNRKLTKEHSRKLSKEISDRARRRFQNPNAFNS
ncbi:MAG: hypothetical protein QM737_18580 [Ferruginibacter sp.]